MTQTDPPFRRSRMTDIGRRFGTLVGTPALAAVATLWSPGPVAACSGGLEFDWAVAHTRGWIATATVVKADYVPDGFYRVVLGDVERVIGSTPSLRQATIAMGAACDQSPDAGERLLVLDGITIQPPYDKPVAYVITGSDAVSGADVARVFRSLPQTDTASPGTTMPPNLSDGVWLLIFAVWAFWLAMRRFARSDQVVSTRSRPHRRRRTPPPRAAVMAGLDPVDYTQADAAGR